VSLLANNNYASQKKSQSSVGKLKDPLDRRQIMIFIYLFTANMPDDIPHLGLTY